MGNVKYVDFNALRKTRSAPKPNESMENPTGVVTSMAREYGNLSASQRKTPKGTQKSSAAILRPGKSPRKRMKRNKEIDPVAFGQRVRELRLKLGLTQAALARALGTKQGTVWSWEHGDVKRPGDIVELARALSTSPEWLRYGEGPQQLQPFRPLDQIIRLYEELGEQRAMVVIEFMRSLLRSPPRPKIAKKVKKTAA